MPMRNPCRKPVESVATHSGLGCPARALSHASAFRGVAMGLAMSSWGDACTWDSMEWGCLQLAELPGQHWCHDGGCGYWHVSYRQHYWGKREATNASV